MPYPAAHGLITLIGDGWSQQEEWQFGLRVAGTERPDAAMMELLGDAATAYMSATSQISSHVRLLAVKWAPQTTAGRYPAGEDAVEYVLPSPVPGSGNAQGIPQITLVTTLITSRSRGRGSKGRFYSPAVTMLPAADGRITVAQAETFAGGSAQLIADVNDIGLGPVSVMSPLGAGSSLPVLSVRIGRVLDTQRRRRNQITEEYVGLPVPPP